MRGGYLSAAWAATQGIERCGRAEQALRAFIARHRKTPRSHPGELQLVPFDARTQSMTLFSSQPAAHSRRGDQAGPREQCNSPELSIVLPVYQERDVIRATMTRLVQAVEETGVTFEVIAVDDGSSDGTREVLEELSRTFPEHLRVMSHPYNKGNGAAIKTGIREARGEVIACLDADGQHDPGDLPRMLPYMAQYDLVVGARTQDYRGARGRNLANKLYNALASWLTQFPIEDLTSGYRLCRASVVRQYVHLFPARFSYPTTSTLAFIKGGHNVKYVPITVRPRQGGKSKIKLLSDGWRFLLIILKIIVIFEPLRVFLPAALMLFVLAIASSAYSMWSLGRLHIPNSAVVLFVVSVVVVLLGLIAEQIATLRVSGRDERQ